MRSLIINAVETVTEVRTKSSVTINLDDYPEFDDMSELEAREWIVKNIEKMKPSEKFSLYETLYEEILDRPSLREKEVQKSVEVKFDDDFNYFDDISFDIDSDY